MLEGYPKLFSGSTTAGFSWVHLLHVKDAAVPLYPSLQKIF